jgi:hypothetical protein
MRLRTTLCFVALLTAQSAIGDDQKPDGDRLKWDLIGTWEAARPAGVPNSMRHIKHVTSTHYTWVTYDSESGAILATSGGTCSVKGDRYEEVCEFAADSHQHLRGKSPKVRAQIATPHFDGTGDTHLQALDLRLSPE